MTISHHCRITAAKFNQMMLKTNYCSTVASNGPWIVASPLLGLNLKITTLLEELNVILKKTALILVALISVNVKFSAFD